MEAREHTDFTMQDFDKKAQELLHIMLTICEARMLTAEKVNSPVGATLTEAALAIKASIRTFVFIERLPGE